MLIVLGRVRPFEWPAHVRYVLLGTAFAPYAFSVTAESNSCMTDALVWEYDGCSGRPRKRPVLRVLEFNGDKLADPLPPAAVRAIMGHYAEQETNTGPRTLFVSDQFFLA